MLQVVGLVISQSYISQEGKNFILDLCKKEGLVVNGYQVKLNNKDVVSIKIFFSHNFQVDSRLESQNLILVSLLNMADNH